MGVGATREELGLLASPRRAGTGSEGLAAPTASRFNGLGITRGDHVPLGLRGAGGRGQVWLGLFATGAVRSAALSCGRTGQGAKTEWKRTMLGYEQVLLKL